MNDDKSYQLLTSARNKNHIASLRFTRGLFLGFKANRCQYLLDVGVQIFSPYVFQDLKPQNLGVNSNCELKVSIDF
jgi:hypothetical protein